jgi:hypothetical protein
MEWRWRVRRGSERQMKDTRWVSTCGFYGRGEHGDGGWRSWFMRIGMIPRSDVGRVD